MNLANCADFDLPITRFDDCDPSVNFSEIERIFIGGPKAGPFANIASGTEWATRSTQNTIGADAIRALIVIGDMPAAAAVVRELSNGRRKAIGKDFTVNYTVDDMSDENAAFFRILDGQPLLRLFGFETQGGKMYHYGNDGIIVNHVSNAVLGRGRDEVEQEIGTITWRNSVRPTRIDSPVAGGTNQDPEVTTFDTVLTFATATDDDAASVAGTAPAMDAELKFEFNAVANPVGTPSSMTINVGGAAALVVDYTSDYNGSPYRFTTAGNVVKTGNFTNGTVNY